MPLGLTWVDAANLAAGALILGVAIFVLAAKPDAWINRLFFLLALMDAASTVLFGLAASGADPILKHALFATYYYPYVAFVALLALFGLVFPKPLEHARLHRALIIGTVGVAAIVTLAYALDHATFWVPATVGAIPGAMAPVGNLLNIAFVLIVGALILRLTHALRRETSESHRRQGAYVLGGMALAYGAFPWTVVAQDIALRGAEPFIAGRWDRILAHWAFLAAALSLVASVVMLWGRIDPEARDERRFVYACYGGVIGLAIIGFLMPDAAIGFALRVLALLAYPVLLGFAVLRYEVFDIDKRLRRAATVSLTTVALTLAFALAENAIEGVIADRVFADISTGWFSGAAAALVAAIAFVPIARASRKAASKLVPELSANELSIRKLEIYRHSVAGALADGVLLDGESRTLAALRSSLGISDQDHARIMAEVTA